MVRGTRCNVEGQFGDRETESQTHAQFKMGDNDQCHILFSGGFFWPKPGGEKKKSAFWHIAKTPLLETHQFPFISKIGPQAFYKVGMCNNY